MEDRISARYTARDRPQPNEGGYAGRHPASGGARQHNGRDFERGPPRGGSRGMNRNYGGQNMYYHPQQGPPPYYNHQGAPFQGGGYHQHPNHQQPYYNQRRWNDWRRDGGGDGWRQDRHPLDEDPETIALLKEENIAPLKKRSVRFPNARYFCRSCEFHCDDIQSCKSHIQSARHDRHATELLFSNYLKNLPPASDAMTESVGNVIMRISEEFGLTPEERQRRLQAVAELEQKLQESVPDAKLELTGSMYSGLALRTSDVNVSLVLPESTSHCEPLMELLNILKHTPTYSGVTNDLRSSTFPSLSYTADEYECKVVVGIWSPSVRAMGRLMATFASMDERFVHLTRALLHWATLCGISNQKKGTLPSIAYAVLVAHFLQITDPPILPIISELCPSVKPEDFPLPQDVVTKFVRRNQQTIGELWFELVRYLGYGFPFSSHDVNLLTAKPSQRIEKHSKKICILDPFNPKRSLSRTVNTAVSDYIIDKLFKVLCRYFCVPQLSYGQLFFTLTINNGLVKERKSRSARPKSDSISESSESENNKSSDYDLAVERLERLKMNEADCEPETREITSADELTRPFDTVTVDEATRMIKLLETRHLKYDFDVNLFTEGEQCPVYCALCQKEGHVRDDCEEEKLPELLPLPEKDEEIEKTISRTLNLLLRDLEPSPEDMKKRDQLVQNLQALVNSVHKYGDAVLQLFGSSANGFGFRDSDLDICITFKDDCHKDAVEHNFLMSELCSILKNSGVFSNVHSIPQAKVPIVKFRCSLTGIDGDLSIYNTLALRNTLLLNVYSKIDPRVKLLGYGLKYFAKICDICDASRGSLSSYAFTLMLIHFLQHTSPPIVPVLQELYDPEKGQPESVQVEGWETWFYSDLENLDKVWPGLGANKCSVGELWLQLFRYYTEEFDFDDCVVTIRQFAPLTRLKKLWNTRTIAIEDPFNLNHNLGGALSAKMNTFIRKAFINGRHLYGGALKQEMSSLQPEDLARALFDPKVLTSGAPPNDRGCRRCGKIGHYAKDCTNRRDSDVPGRKNRGKGKNDAAWKEEAAAVRNSGPSKKKDFKTLIDDPSSSWGQGRKKVPSDVPSTNPEGSSQLHSSSSSSIFGLQEPRNSQAAARAMAQGLHDRSRSSNRSFDVHSSNSSSQNDWHRSANLHSTYDRTKGGVQSYNSESSSSSWRRERTETKARGQTEFFDNVFENKEQSTPSFECADEFMEHQDPALLGNRGGYDGEESRLCDESKEEKETKDGEPIDVLRLFDIANECGGTISYSLGKVPVLDGALLSSSLEAPQLEKASLPPSVPDNQRKDFSEETVADQTQSSPPVSKAVFSSMSAALPIPHSISGVELGNSPWDLEASNNENLFQIEENVNYSGTPNEKYPALNSATVASQSSDVALNESSCPTSTNPNAEPQQLGFEAMEESALSYAKYSYPQAASPVEIPSSFQHSNSLVQTTKSDAIGPPPGFLVHPRSQNSISASAPVENHDGSTSAGEDGSKVFPVGESAVAAPPVHRPRQGFPLASQQPRLQFPASGPESPALNGSPNMSYTPLSSTGTALASPGLALNTTGLPFHPVRMPLSYAGMPLNVSGMTLNSGDPSLSYMSFPVNSVGMPASTGLRVQSPGAIASSAGVLPTTTVTTSPATSQQQSLANFYPQLVQGQMSAPNPSSTVYGVQPWRHMPMQQVLLQRPQSSGTESGQQQQQQPRTLTFQQFQNPQQIMSAPGLPSSSTSQQQLPGQGLRHSVLLQGTSLQQGAPQPQRLSNPPQQFMNTGMPFIGSTQQPFMNSFQNFGATQNGGGASLAFVNSSGQYVTSPPPSVPQGFLSSGSQSSANFSSQQAGIIAQDLGVTARQIPASSSQALYPPVLHPIPVQQQQQRHLNAQISNKSVQYPQGNIVFMPTLGAPGPLFMGSSTDTSASPTVSYAS